MHSSANSINVEFEPGFNGGYPQTFIIEYRKAASGPWTQLEVDNSHTNYNIKYLEQGTQYELRMYSFSKLGNSTISDNYSIYTMNAKGMYFYVKIHKCIAYMFLLHLLSDKKHLINNIGFPV